MVLLCAGLIVAATAATAQGASPLVFLEGIYKAYRGDNAKGFDYSRPEVIRRLFAPQLAKAIVKDFAAARKKNEVPALNGDPFIDAQDWEVADLKVEVRDAVSRSATGVVTFTFSGKPRTVTLDLVRTGKGWRIADISAPSGSLRELYGLK
jgi:hypothetical protein